MYSSLFGALALRRAVKLLVFGHLACHWDGVGGVNRGGGGDERFVCCQLFGLHSSLRLALHQWKSSGITRMPASHNMCPFLLAELVNYGLLNSLV